MRRSKSSGHMVDLLFVLALFCVFAASALLVVLLGANVYKSTVSGMDRSYTARTSLAYLTAKVRQNDSPYIEVGELADGSPALQLYQQIGDEQFCTWIYHSDGALREVMLPQSAEPDAESGQAIIEVEGFDVFFENGLLVISLEDAQGRRYTQRLSPRCIPTVEAVSAP